MNQAQLEKSTRRPQHIYVPALVVTTPHLDEMFIYIACELSLLSFWLERCGVCEVLPHLAWARILSR